MAERGYFSHDLGSRTDRKLVRLRMKMGMEGIGIFWCLVEMLYEEGGYLMRNECERIAFELQSDSERIQTVIQDFELFVLDQEKFWSNSVLRRIELRDAKSESARKSARKRWGNANEMRTHPKRNAEKEIRNASNEIKVNETNQIKENQTEEGARVFSENQEEEKESNPNHWEEKFKEFHSAYPESMNKGNGGAFRAFCSLVMPLNGNKCQIEADALTSRAKAFSECVKDWPLQKRTQIKNWLSDGHWNNDWEADLKSKQNEVPAINGKSKGLSEEAIANFVNENYGSDKK